MLVLTIDQQASRNAEDRIEELLDQLRAEPWADRLVRGFERTAGDEVQGLLDQPSDAVDASLALVRDGRWYVGVGVGPVREPLPDSVRAAAGPAFVHAREAVDRAKASPARLAVVGPDPESARDAEALLALLAAVVQRRSRQGWEVVDLMARGLAQKDVAERLGISPQAVSQRLRSALWNEERRVRPLAVRLLAQADAPGAKRGRA
ncbi:SatD family protein [Actinopolymorpha alba]|uniref:SatD family protein n=1 Tax=Actinopolymorpha alba TaxID=533267 RepID=UPI0003634C14|nr:SatD family protein [Actinopolymorpha alba]